MRRRNYLGIAILIVCLLSSGALSKTTIVHFAYESHGQPYIDFITAAVESFERLHPEIEIEVVFGTNYTKALTMAIGGVAPDVYDMSTNLAIGYYLQGLIRDLTPLIQADPDFKLTEFIPQALVGYQTNGVTFGIPASIYQVLCFYNKDLFAELGLPNPNDLGSKWDWSAVADLGKKLTRDRNADGVNDQWGVRVGNSFYRWPIWVHQAGGGIFNQLTEPTQPTFDSPAGREGLGFLADLYTKHGAAVEISKMGQSVTLFYNGQVGFTLDDGPSMLGTLPQQNVSFDWDIAQLPMGPANNGTYLIMNGFQMSASTQHPDAAWQWLKYLVGREAS